MSRQLPKLTKRAKMMHILDALREAKFGVYIDGDQVTIKNGPNPINVFMWDEENHQLVDRNNQKVLSDFVQAITFVNDLIHPH